MINENGSLKPLENVILNAVVFTLEIFILYTLYIYQKKLRSIFVRVF